MKATSHTRTSLDTKSTQRTYQHQEKNTATGHQKPDGEGQMDVDPESRRRMRGKTRLTSLEQLSVPPANASPDTTQQEAEEDHEDKRGRIDEPESTVPTAAQDEVLTPCPVTFDSDAKNDDVAVDVPLPEETVEMSGENSQGWITEEAPSSQSHLAHDKCDSAKR